MTHVALGMHLLHHGEASEIPRDFMELVIEHDEVVSDLLRWLDDHPTTPVPVELAMILGHFRLKVRQVMDVRSPVPR